MQKESKAVQILLGAAVFTFVVYWLTKILEQTTENNTASSEVIDLTNNGRNS